MKLNAPVQELLSVHNDFFRKALCSSKRKKKFALHGEAAHSKNKERASGTVGLFYPTYSVHFTPTDYYHSSLLQDALNAGGGVNK